jgi:thiamine kinase-like enzyme
MVSTAYLWTSQRKYKSCTVEKIYKGNILTIIYFEFLDLVPLPDAGKDERLVKLTLDLYKISLSRTVNSFAPNIPKPVRDFKHHVKYRANIDTTKIKLLEQGIAYDKLEKSVMASKCILTHGDIQQTNVFVGSTLIDWDYFGIFPIGADPAFLYYNFLHDNKQNLRFGKWLKRYYKQRVSEEDWKDFERNFLFILFVISFDFKESEQRNDLQKQLAEALKQKIDSDYVLSGRFDIK